LRWTSLVVLLLCCGTLVDSKGKSGVRRLGPQGGVVDTDFGVRLYLPAGALAEETLVTLTPEPQSSAEARQVVRIEPQSLQLGLPGVIAFLSPQDARDKVAQLTDSFHPLPGRLLEPGVISAPLLSFGIFGLVSSSETCANGLDDDGDGAADCGDPLCAGDGACPLACQSNADCPCGAQCNGGGCTTSQPRFCATQADCGGLTCAAPQYRTMSCGFLMCSTATASGDGGISLSDGGASNAVDAGMPTQDVLVRSCLGSDEQCDCDTCLRQTQCPGGTQCLEATRKGGSVSCGKSVCR
jgi:hypothetical protein